MALMLNELDQITTFYRTRRNKARQYYNGMEMERTGKRHD